MTIDDLPELQYIIPIANAASALDHGILSHNAAARLAHESIAMPEVQVRRAAKVVPGGMPLHDYANLYICARNPMMYKKHHRHAKLCVLRISTDVLYWPGVVIASGNASSSYTRFLASPGGLAEVDADMVFAEFWTDTDPVAFWRKKAAKCAEVLVPRCVPPEAIRGAWVSCEDGRAALAAEVPGIPATTNPHMFFWRGG